jgi:LysR family transcriptional regulator, benzoate and cis,cis-muconate-responsive activator of ben and cat genes
MLENRHLRYFIEVARSLHVRRAAERLHIAQPALTQNIQQLESELGVELFHRESRHLRLTEAGEIFLVEAEQSLRQFDHAQKTAQRAARGEVGKLVLGFQSTAGLSVVPNLLQNFRTEFPEVEVTLIESGSTAQKRALRSGEIDIGLVYTLPDAEFAYRELEPESLVIALPEDHPLAAKDSVALAELAQEVFILSSNSAAEVLRHTVMTACANSGFQPKRVQEITTVQTALGLVSARFGVSILPASVQVLIRRGVTLRPIRDGRIQVGLTFLWMKDNRSPVLTNLVKCL